MELNADLAFSKARDHADASTLANFGLDGKFIANSASFIGSFGLLMDNLGPWFGGLQWRDLGKYPIIDGDEFPQDNGYSEINLDIDYKFSGHLKGQLTIFNLANTRPIRPPTSTPSAFRASQRRESTISKFTNWSRSQRRPRSLTSSSGHNVPPRLRPKRKFHAQRHHPAATVAALAVAGQATAHAHLILGSPKAGETVAAPKELKLQFNQRIVPGESGVTISGPGGAAVAAGSLALDPKSKPTSSSP